MKHSLSPPAKQHLYEVWGDTVDSRHLAGAIGIGAVVSLGAYCIAHHLLHPIVESAQMAKTYAMLVGVFGCLLAGVICARLFVPKRDVQEHAADPAFREQVVVDLLKEYGSLGRLEDLSAEVIAELRELGLYDLLREAQAREENTHRLAIHSIDVTSSLSGGRG